MHSLTSILLFAMLATLALAAPLQKRVEKRSYTVPRLRSPSYVRDPLKAMQHAYGKHGWTINFGPTAAAAATGPSNSTLEHHHHHHHHFGNSTTNSTGGAASTAGASTPGSTSVSSAMDASSTSASGSSSAASSSSAAGTESGDVATTAVESNAEFISPVMIGGQTLNMDFDTGSSDLWVFSTDLPSSDDGSHTLFNPSKSSTWKQLQGSTFGLSYGDGSAVSGIVGTDTVNIGGATVTSQAVEAATSVSSAFISDSNSDGLVGLAFSILNSVEPKAQNTFFANIMDDLEEPVFTADLVSDGTGTYEFGVIDTTKYTGDISFTPVDASSGFWQFDSASYTVGGTSGTNTGATAIADTGTSLILVDDAVVTAYYAKVSGAYNDNSVGGYVYPCSADLPDFGVAIGSSYVATVPSADITFAQVSDSLCFGGIQSNGGEEFQIYGDVLLRQQFVVFDGGNESIGFAARS